MSLIEDLRAVSENAVEQLAARFSDLPRPLLAAIGAGDMAVARFADLRESLADSLGDRVGPPSVDLPDVRAAVADLPAKVQKVAAEVATSIEQFAAEAPGRAQELIAQLPDKLTEVQIAAQSLSPDQVRETMDAYAQLAGMILGNLADRGTRTWTKVRSAGLRPGAVVEPSDASSTTATARASAAAAARASAAAARAAAAVRATTQEPAAGAEPDSADPLEVAEPKTRTRTGTGKPPAAKDLPAQGTPAEDTAPEGGVAAAQKPAARRTPRNSPHKVTTPDGGAEVTVAPADVIPKGAHVEPSASATVPPSPGRPAPGTPAADSTDVPIGI